MSASMSSARRWNLAILAALLALITSISAACGSSNPLGGGEISGDLKSIAVGSADFTESKIIAEIYAQALEANGFNVRRQFGIGSRETYVPAVQDHSIDLIPEYTGNLLQYFDKETTATTSDAVLLGLLKALPGDLSILYPSPAEDKDTLAVTCGHQRAMNDGFRLDGRTAMVTGASRGLGRAMAEALGRAGAKLVLVSRNAEAVRRGGRRAGRFGVRGGGQAARPVGDRRHRTVGGRHLVRGRPGPRGASFRWHAATGLGGSRVPGRLGPNRRRQPEGTFLPVA